MKNTVILFCFLFFNFQIQAQKYSISGVVTDAETGKPLEGSSIELRVKKALTAITNKDGEFHFPKANKDIYLLDIRNVGYLVSQQKVNISSDTTFSIALTPFVTELATVTVTGESIKDAKPSVNTLSKTQILAIPTVGSERDILRMMVLMPGVKSDNEGSAGIYVRGGGADQNLFLINGATLYKSSHLFGFLSPFNSDVIEKVELYKGAFPAQFGGRLSSVLDIKLKTASMTKYQVSGSVGIITSRALVELPLIKNRLSVMLAARRSYFNIFTQLFNGSGTSEAPNYYFYDFNGNMSLKVGKKSLWQVYSYQDKDYLKANGDDDLEKNQYQQKWYSSIIGTSFYVPVSSKVNNLTEITSSRYLMQLNVERSRKDEAYSNIFKTSLRDLTFKNTTEIELTENVSIRLGLSQSRYEFRPSELSYFANEKIVAQSGIDSTYANESNCWIDNEFKFEHWRANVGFRYGYYSSQNKSFVMPQPRLSISYFLTESTTLKASLTRIYQPLHLLSNTGLGFPVDIWLPSNSAMNPEFSDQITLGGQKQLETMRKGRWLLNAEVYYKRMNNIISYQDGHASNDFTEYNQNKINDLSKIITTGQGLSYGLELMAEKKTGKIKGWISYTLSKTTNQFNELNNGLWFSARQDQRHQLGLVGTYNLSKRWTFNGSWTFLTGQAITLPQAVYSFPSFDFVNNKFENYSNLIYVNGGRNSYRMKPYHRLDVGIQRQTTHKWGAGIFEISIFNIYNRRNPYFYYLSSGQLVYSVSLFGIIPSISYTFRIYSK